MLASNAVRAAVLVSLAVIVNARAAAATPYETFIDIGDQSELEDLLAAQDISQDTYDELLDLLQRGVNLSTAERSELYSLPNLTYEEVDKLIAYRKLQQGVIRDPAELVGANVLSEEKLLAISAFLVVTPGGKSPLAAHGWIRAMTRVSHKDRIAPPLAVRARFTALKHLQAAYSVRNDPEIAAHLGEVLWKVGQRDEAQKIWRAALTENPDHETLITVMQKFRP